MTTEWYLDFVDADYRPSSDDLIALFRVEPARGISIAEAVGRIASESSIGTWTKLTTMTPEKRRLMAKAFFIRKPWVKVAYPVELFETGNMPQVLSSIAGNIFGMKAIKNLRLEDVSFPPALIKSFPGPQFGIEGIRKIFGVKDRPLTVTVPKPKLGMSSEEHAAAGYEAWLGGLDLLKDDENLSSQSFNQFERRARLSFKMRDKAEKETGEKKSYLINVTAETREMLRRANLVKKLGGEYVMVDILTAGWAAVQTLREECERLGLAIHAHRAFHAVFTRNRKHGMSMVVVAKVARLQGVDQIHVGTVVGKLESPKEEVLTLKEEITSDRVEESGEILPQDWCGIKPVFPVSSGGLHPGLVPEVMKLLGRDILIQAGGGVWGHPDGGRAGAMALRQAIEATLDGVPLTKYAESHRELKRALETWGYSRPR
ncbi:MAG: ribulose 1,5-bisphosphate carboxylase [Candidatus Hadarchaeum yellowstonense]|uniref:Ribulose bisphosphate carboxylase n=1 Tax=Hadarchaeum yellowstonense TaxID=1776334 RepID=A0A147JSH4_HADYE|nr:MAG: ribulose 1,5-bisphosphate carboxylase [Candidatus Hadarchaeum yellowstonense]